MPSHSDDPQTALRSALGDLRDRTVAAIDSSRLTDLEDALDLYKELMVTALDYFEYLEHVVDAPLSGSFQYGREMEWLTRDAGALIISALVTGSFETIYRVLGLPYDLLSEGWRRHSLTLCSHGLDLYGRCWSEGLTTLDPPAWNRVRHSVLLQLENFADFYLFTRRDSTPLEMRAGVSEAELRLLSNFGRSAIDNGRIEDLRGVVQVLRKTFVQGPRALRVVMAEEEPGTSAEEMFIRPTWILLLGLRAYVLLLVKRNRLGTAVAGQLLDALNVGDGARPDWRDYLAAMEDGDRRYMWHMWETMLWEERSGVITFDEFVALAFAGMLASERPDRESANVPEDQRFQVDRVVRSLDELKGEPWSGLFGALPQLVEARRSAAGVVERLARSSEENVVAIPLDPDKVLAFRTAARDEWRIQLTIPPRVSEEVIQQDELSSASSAVALGINTLVPKEYFARTQVYARPSDLAEQFVRALARGETEYWLSKAAEVSRSSVPLAEAQSAARTAIATMRDLQYDPSVVVFKDWTILDALRDTPVDPFGADVDAGHLDGVPIALSYENVSFGFMVADFKQLGVLRRVSMSARRAGDEVIEGGRLLIGIEQIDEALAHDLWRDNPSLAQTGEESPRSEPEAIHILRQRVVVRVLEDVEFEVRHGDAAQIFDVV
jgi:hypothetical protein